MQPVLPPFSVGVRTEERRCIVSVAGELDLATAPELRAALDVAEDGEAQAITLDLSGVTFMDSTGVAVLVEYTARSRADGDRIRILAGPAVARVLEVSGTGAHLPLID